MWPFRFVMILASLNLDAEMQKISQHRFYIWLCIFWSIIMQVLFISAIFVITNWKGQVHAQLTQPCYQHLHCLWGIIFIQRPSNPALLHKQYNGPCPCDYLHRYQVYSFLGEGATSVPPVHLPPQPGHISDARGVQCPFSQPESYS
jgi:hypothetical protein